MIEKIKSIYESRIYTICIILLALVSLFTPISTNINYLISGVFVIDLIMTGIMFVKYSPNKNIWYFFRKHTFDIIACIPLQFLSIFKTYRLLKLFQVSRIFKIDRATHFSYKKLFQKLYTFQTFKELIIYFLIYLIANVYLFENIENVSILDAVFWVVQTVTTVGYGDFAPTHPSTKILSIFLMIFGVALVGYINGAIVSGIISQYKKEDK